MDGRERGLDLRSSPGRLRGVGPAKARSLEEAGVRTLRDLLLHLPARYEDRRRLDRISDIGEAGAVAVEGRLQQLTRIQVRRRRLHMVRGLVTDATGSLAVVWFNRPYLLDQVAEGVTYRLYGRVRLGRQGWELINPTIERPDSPRETAGVVPVYRALGKLGPAALRHLQRQMVEQLDLEGQVREWLPEELRARYGLPDLAAALAFLHDPPDGADVEALNERRSPAHLRLIYGELLELQVELALLRRHEIREPKVHRYRIDDEVRERVRQVLPFRLTGAQRRVLKQIADDLASPYPMLRLLQGDVGSGKTIVAAIALILGFESGLQGAFMAPTELLAEQHYANLRRLLGGRYRIGLFTRSAEGLSAARRRLASGELDLAVGTHALIQEGTEFRCLGLAVIDEQHRFGVAQRQQLQRKGERPDVLVMTATPIPRTLALTAYGDLELSLLDELPPGRTPVATEVAPESHRRRVYRELGEELAAGAQAYVVFPIIEESDKVAAASVMATGTDLQRQLGDVPSAILHGRVPADQRERIMARFAAGEIRVLIATTVIEVGVDVPEATVMVIESAERFGLSQLHQLRGRVGRGKRPSRCVALHGKLSAEGRRRLEIFAESTDGFRIAEADLELRGPGDLLGKRQAGLPGLRVASLLGDRDWLERARADAREILARLEEPAFDALRRRLGPRVRDRYEKFAGG